jgi:hypothetical protein
MVGTIRQTDPLLNFEGYKNKDETKKKIIGTSLTVISFGFLENAFRKGDMVFTSGDILYWVLTLSSNDCGF